MLLRAAQAAISFVSATRSLVTAYIFPGADLGYSTVRQSIRSNRLSHVFAVWLREPILSANDVVGPRRKTRAVAE